jgi:tetratricopeptide (TPR) repeat protein
MTQTLRTRWAGWPFSNYQEAASTLQQTLQNQPNDASLLFDYARAAYSIGRVSDAQTALQNALAANPPAAQAGQARRILDMITLAADPAQASAANTRIGEILKSEPDDVPALMARAAASEFNADPATAEQAYERGLARYPDFTPAEIRLARLYADEPAKLDRAYELGNKVHDELPNDPQVTKILGIILFQHGDYSRAVNMLKESSMNLKSDAELYYFLGNSQYHLKRLTESKASLQQALTLNLSGKQADSAKQILGALK